jgi:predicted nucleic acid-binding protein
MSVSGKFLLDTNIVIALLEGDAAVLSNLDQAPVVLKYSCRPLCLASYSSELRNQAGLTRTPPDWNNLQ